MTGPGAEMPFLEHLEELRWRIMWSMLALLVGVGVAFYFLFKYDAIRRSNLRPFSALSNDASSN